MPYRSSHFPFEPAGREGQVRQRRQRRIACGHDAFEFDAAVRPAGQEQVHDPQPVTVVMGRHQGQPKTVGQEFLGLLRDGDREKPGAALDLGSWQRSELAGRGGEQVG